MTRKLLHRFMILCCVLFFTNKIVAQQLDTEFWFVVPDASNLHGPGCDRPVFFMFTADNEDAEVTMSMPAYPAFKPRTFSLKKYSSNRLVFNAVSVDTLENKINEAGSVTKKGILITATKPISVYYQLDGSCSKDIFSLKGGMAMGNEFYTPFQTQYPRHNYADAYRQINIVASQNGTSVTIVPKGDIVGTNAGQSKTITLNRGETFLAREKTIYVTGGSGQQYSGSYITSSAPVAVTVSDDPVESHLNTGHDMIGDQIVPTDNIGSEYVTVRGYTSDPEFSTYDTYDYIYIVATKNGTTITKNGSATVLATLNAGDTYKEVLKDNSVYYKTSQPAYLFQQSGVGGEMGGALIPSMYSISARRLVFYKQTFNKNALFLIFRKGTAKGFQLNGGTMNVTETAIPGVSDWVYARYEINNTQVADGPCVIDNSLGAFALGYFTYTSGTTALYGFLSNFGKTIIWPEITYRCAGKDIVLDAGYGSKYEWSTGATTPTITVSAPGEYSVKVTVNNTTISLKTFVVDDWFNASINTPDTAYVNLSHPVHLKVKRSAGKTYAWTFQDGVPATSADSALTVKWTKTGQKTIDLRINSDLIGKLGEKCDTVLKTKTIVVVNSQEHHECDDYYGAYHSGSTWTFDVLKNDIVPCNENFLTMTTLISSSLASTAGSTIGVSGNKLTYIPKAGFLGTDTIYYESEAESPGCSKRISANVYIYVYPNKYRGCATGSPYPIGINDTKNNVKVNWSGGSISNNSFPAGTATGTYNINATVTFKNTIAAFNNNIPTQYVLDIVPVTMTWNGKVNSNWNDPANWNENSVPLGCTVVHIPGNTPNYPSLDKTNTIRTLVYGEPECDKIIYHFGGEVAKPHYLNYNQAYVQYNWGYTEGNNNNFKNGDPLSADFMKRGRWYALAAPLKRMVSGDFSVGGYPNFWQQGFIATPSTNNTWIGEWKRPDNNNAFDIAEEQIHGISVWAGSYFASPDSLGENDHSNLNALKGVLEMPYFENKPVSDLHRIHSYTLIDTTSWFKYYYYQKPGLPITNDNPGSIKRGQSAYRFVFEGKLEQILHNDQFISAYKVTVPAGTEIMVGNPIVSSLDFNTFYELNTTKISPYYRLYIDKSWTEFSYTAGSQIISRYVAPLQAFFVKTRGTTGSVDLYFPLELVSVTRPKNQLHQLKSTSSTAINDVFYIKAGNEAGETYATVSLAGYDENIPRMFTQGYPELPQVSVSDVNGDKNSVYFSPASNQELTLHIDGSPHKDVTLSFYNTDKLHVNSLQLKDTKNNRTVDLLKTSTYTIPKDKFVSSSYTLSLLVGTNYAPTTIDNVENTDTQIYMTGPSLCIHSKLTIAEVKVYSTHGKLLSSEQTRNIVNYTKDLTSFGPGLYIISVKLDTGEVISGKIVK